jgi:hypothetical protein
MDMTATLKRQLLRDLFEEETFALIFGGLEWIVRRKKTLLFAVSIGDLGARSNGEGLTIEGGLLAIRDFEHSNIKPCNGITICCEVGDTRGFSSRNVDTTRSEVVLENLLTAYSLLTIEVTDSVTHFYNAKRK